MVIRSAIDLSALSVLSSLRPLRKQKLALDLAGLDEGERLRLQERLNDLVNDCGCSTGSVFSLAGGVLAAAFAIGIADLGVLATILTTFAAIFLSGGAGKLAGLALASYRFRRLCRVLAARVAAGAVPVQSAS